MPELVTVTVFSTVDAPAPTEVKTVTLSEDREGALRSAMSAQLSRLGPIIPIIPIIGSVIHEARKNHTLTSHALPSVTAAPLSGFMSQIRDPAKPTATRKHPCECNTMTCDCGGSDGPYL